MPRSRSSLRLPLLALTLVALAPEPAPAFEGCRVMGTWTMVGTILTLVEDGNGAVTGVTYDTLDDSVGMIPSGSRAGAAVALTIADELPGSFAGSMTDCDTLPGTLAVDGPLLDATMTRLRGTYCGDGILDAGETCDDGNLTHDDLCTIRCLPAACGDGIVASANGEACDPGGGCCTPGCTLELAGEVCRPSLGICDPAETCSGASAACPASRPPGAFGRGTRLTSSPTMRRRPGTTDSCCGEPCTSQPPCRRSIPSRPGFA